MIQEAGIDLANLPPESPDMPFGLASGSGLLFGVTGGVTEAVIRSCVEEKTSESLQAISYCGVRGFDGIKEAVVDIGGKELRIAVVHGLSNADKLIRMMKAGKIYYDFVEVMACPGGCISGAGQPVIKSPQTKAKRTESIYDADGIAQLKYSDENPQVSSIYKDLKAKDIHHLLHVHYPVPVQEEE